MPVGVPIGIVLALTSDRLVLAGLERVADELGLEVHDVLPAAGPEPTAVVLDPEQPSSLEQITAWRQRNPTALLAGHLATPRRDLWLDAQRAGCDLVA